MAVLVTPFQSTVRLIVQVGVDESGNAVYRTRTYNRVKPAAMDQDVFDAAQALAGLQEHALNGVQRVLTNDLVSA